MSKIPQGEWDAIAARYAQGESISRIAQSYGCTPPAIHYILKRSKQRIAPNNPQPQTAEAPALSALQRRPLGTSGRPEAPHTVASTTRTDEELGTARLAPAEKWPATPQPVERAPPMSNGRPQPAIPQRLSGTYTGGSRSSPFTAGLDRELHGRAEAAMAAFRASFDAALAGGSAHVREQLRQAASDLMRVAARTTIVLDRLNASAERTAGRAEGQSPPGRGRF
jgi:transposase-like protein